MLEYDAVTARIFEISPYTFFAVIGIVFATSSFILLLLKHGYSIPKYTKIFLLSGLGLLIGARFFGVLTGLYVALASNTPVTIYTFLNTGIVFYGGLIGFLVSFLLICKKWNKKIEYRIVDIAVVCIPLFHFWGRLGCFFGGCCFGIETQSAFSILYTTAINGYINTASRIPVQLIEAILNLVIFAGLFKLLSMAKLKGQLMKIYLAIYAIMRIVLEFFRGDLARGVWYGVSFSQAVSAVILMVSLVSTLLFNKKEKAYV